MSIALDASSAGGSNTTYSHTVGSGANRRLFVFVGTVSGNTVSAVSYNGVAMTLLRSQTQPNGGGATFTNYLYSLMAPATGAHNVVITGTPAASQAISYTGCEQAGTADVITSTGDTGTATSRTDSVTVVANQAWTIFTTINNAGSASAGTGATVRGSTGITGYNVFDSNGGLSTGSQSMQATTAGSPNWCDILLAFAPSASAAALAAVSSLGIATTAALTATAAFATTTAIGFATVATLTANGPLRATSSLGIGSTAALTATARFSAASSFGFSTSANMVVPLRATSGIRFSTSARLTTGTEALHEAAVRIALDGVDVSAAASDTRTRLTPLSIHDVINDAPNTCDLTFQGDAPTGSQRLRVTLNIDAPRLLFDGTLQRRDTTYAGTSDNLLLGYPCSAIDGGAQANRRRPFGTWVNVSASTIATYITSVFAPGFTSAHVQAGLEPVSIIFDGSDTFMGCLARLAKLIGGYCFVEDLDVALFTDADVIGLELPDDIDESGGRFLDEPQIHLSIDDSQLQTRVYGKGHAESVLADVLAGETILPLPDAVMFGTVGVGGLAITGTTPDGAQSQLIAYAGVQRSVGGSLVGPGVAPSTAPTLAAVLGTGLPDGTFGYAVVDVTAAGKSLPSPIAHVTTGPLADPTVAPVVTAASPFGADNPSLTPGVTYDYVYTYSTNSNPASHVGETRPSPQASATANASNGNPAIGTYLAVTFPVSSSPAVTYIKVYRRVHNTGAFELANYFVNGYTFYQDLYGTTAGNNPPATNTATLNQVAVSGIAIGAPPTTSRELHRTVVNGSQLKFHTTIANNTATALGANDTTADASLGANAPTGDTSGITQPVGQINAGSIAILTASAGPFQSGGGWTTTGVRYTGITGNTLTGIPATGPGSILTTIPYGTQILPAPSLTGVTGLTLALLKGTPVSIWIQRDDLAAQAEQAAIDLAAGRTPADGVYEGPIVIDARRGEASLIDLCDVTLQLYSRPIITITYDTRDPKTKSGRPVTFDLPSFGLAPITLTIQSVDITEIDQFPGTLPRFHVTASTVRHSLDDLLRSLIAAKQAA